MQGGDEEHEGKAVERISYSPGRGYLLKNASWKRCGRCAKKEDGKWDNETRSAMALSMTTVPLFLITAFSPLLQNKMKRDRLPVRRSHCRTKEPHTSPFVRLHYQ